MYCRKCGKEMGERDAFCPRCGEKVVGGSPMTMRGLKAPTVSGILSNSRIARLGAMKWYFFVGTFLLLVCALLAGKEMIMFKYDVWIYGDSMSVGLLEGYDFLRFVFRAVYFAAVIWAAYPIVKDEEWKKHHLMPAFAISIIGLGVFGITLLSGFDVVGSAGGGWSGDVYYGSGTSSWDWIDVTIGLTNAGWIFLASSAVSAVLMYKVSRNIMGEQTYYQEKMAEDILCETSERGVKTHVRCPHCGRIQKSVSSFCEECYEPLSG